MEILHLYFFIKTIYFSGYNTNKYKLAQTNLYLVSNSGNPYTNTSYIKGITQTRNFSTKSFYKSIPNYDLIIKEHI